MKKLLVVFICLLMIMMSGCGVKAKYNVGVIQLAEHPALDAATQGFKDTLEKEFGDEINIVVDNAKGESSNCAVIVDGFVKEEVDLIMANATSALQAASAATNTIPILGTSVTSYVDAFKLENFNGTIGTNVSGTSDLAPLDEQAKMLVDLLPDCKMVGILYCSSEDNSKYQVKVISEIFESLGIKVVAKSFTDSNDIASVADALISECDALYIPTDNMVASCGETLNNIATHNNIPIICGEEGTCAKCGIATLTIDYYELGVATGKMAIKILKGEANVSEMPIEYFSNPVKKYMKEFADKCNVKIPDDYIEIETE